MSPKLRSGWEELARSDVDVERGELRLTLDSGESILVDLGWPGKRDLPQAEKPIVYLDQNHWVTLAKAIHAPDDLSAQVRQAALDLIALVESREALLPFSSGHLVETVPRGKQRRDVALTMLRLSRRLQMRNPLEVRRHELAAGISGQEPRCPAVFTLEPDVLFVDSAKVASPDDFPALWKELHGRMTSVTATIAVMLEDDEDAADDPGPAARERWLMAYRALARHVHEEKLSREKTRSIAHDALLSDLSVEAVTASQMAGAEADHATWVKERAKEDFERAPHIATLQEMLYHRLRNSEDNWEANDLIDMHFLSCAAGYADLVVAERKFSDYLSRAGRRYPNNADVAATLPEAIEALRGRSN
jgi:hypothetical protein